ncbi:RluA family pseudouridine synthase [Vulgatibacter incomptus]|uniref:Pseudouridine synthase n=1 Tax=Vulgatibacter incomptus TaxID=1391653 RepID=A0A0K1PG80_9BACT|nr:RluA family pseudouridine synthase [Vulgatibacter incomptus]AKU92426.1 ribosomal large subunit pseudouridine synthase D [Vulgatibacter incomptus]
MNAEAPKLQDETDEVGAEYEVPFRVEPNYAGWRLDLYLAEKIRRLSRTKVQRLIREDLVHDGPRPLKAATPVWAGMEFRLRRRRDPEPVCERDFGVAFEDDDVLVVDKPAGLPVHPSARYFVHTLTSVLRERQGPGEKWDIAHRLDRETSGLVVCGKRPEVTRRLKMLFERPGQVNKEYQAIVHGWPEDDEARIDLPLGLLDHPLKVKMGVVPLPEGKASLTEIRVERRFHREVPWRGPELAVVRCFPRTGRQHQIRAHLAAVGYPIVGDKIYGPCDRYFADFADGKLAEEAQAELVLSRHALHAAAITLRHPMTGQPLHVTAPLPADMATLIS